jgi:hypothetical protein
MSATTIKCAGCNVEFSPTRPGQKFHKTACRKKSFRRAALAAHQQSPIPQAAIAKQYGWSSFNTWANGKDWLQPMLDLTNPLPLLLESSDGKVFASMEHVRAYRDAILEAAWFCSWCGGADSEDEAAETMKTLRQLEKSFETLEKLLLAIDWKKSPSQIHAGLQG